jgi:hypothetical protein
VSHIATPLYPILFFLFIFLQRPHPCPNLSPPLRYLTLTYSLPKLMWVMHSASGVSQYRSKWVGYPVFSLHLLARFGGVFDRPVYGRRKPQYFFSLRLLGCLRFVCFHGLTQGRKTVNLCQCYSESTLSVLRIAWSQGDPGNVTYEKTFPFAANGLAEETRLVKAQISSGYYPRSLPL